MNDASSEVSNPDVDAKAEKSPGENPNSDGESNEAEGKNKRRQRRQRTHFSSSQLQELESLFASNKWENFC